MKKMKKYLLTMLAMLTIVFTMQVSASAAVYFKGCTSNSFTISWDKPSVPSYYTFKAYQIANSSGEVLVEIPDANKLTYTFNNLSTGIHEKLSVYYRYTYYGSSRSYYMGYTDVCTNPSATDIQEMYTSGKNYATLNMKGYLADKATGLQFEVKNLANGTKSLLEKDYYSSASKTLALNTGYTVRVRAYVKNSTDGKKYYGSWSKSYPVAIAGFSGKANNKSAGFTLTLKRGSKIKKYVIYTSAKRDSGYSKAATVTVTGKTKTVRITKSGGKRIPARRTRYIRVVPYVVVGKTVKASVIRSQGSIYIYK